jgi:hypothetical protein
MFARTVTTLALIASAISSSAYASVITIDALTGGVGIVNDAVVNGTPVSLTKSNPVDALGSFLESRTLSVNLSVLNGGGATAGIYAGQLGRLIMSNDGGSAQSEVAVTWKWASDLASLVPTNATSVQLFMEMLDNDTVTKTAKYNGSTRTINSLSTLVVVPFNASNYGELASGQSVTLTFSGGPGWDLSVGPLSLRYSCKAAPGSLVAGDYVSGADGCGTVPLPAPLALIGLGLFGIAVSQRAKKST